MAFNRRFKDIVELHIADLGGLDAGLSEAQISLCKRAACLQVELERREGQLSLGRDVDLDEYNRLVGNLRRVFETIGLKRAARDVTNPVIEHFMRPLDRGAK